MKNILFESSEYGYEEGHTVRIWEENGKYFVRQCGNCVCHAPFHEDHTYEVTSDEAIKIALEEANFEDSEYLEIPYEK